MSRIGPRFVDEDFHSPRPEVTLMERCAMIVSRFRLRGPAGLTEQHAKILAFGLKELPAEAAKLGIPAILETL